MSFLDEFNDMLEKQAEEERSRIIDFNDKFPPHKELTVIGEDEVDSEIAGIWFNDDGQVSYSYRMQNGLYHPNKINHIPKEIASEIALNLINLIKK